MPRERAVQQTEDRRRFRFSFSFIAKATLVILVVYALLNGVWLARDILFIAFLAILYASFLSIFVEWLEPYMPRWTATLLVFLALLGLLVGFVFLTWPSLQDQVATVRQEVPRMINEVVGWVQGNLQALSGNGPASGAFRQQVSQRMGAEAATIVAGALPLLNTVIGALSGLLVVVFAGVFLTVNPSTYLNGLLAMVPERGRGRLRDTLVEAGETLRRWIGGMSVSMVVIFILITSGLWMLGVPAFLALGVIAGLLVFIPFVGPILSAVPAIALGFTVSPLMALWVTLLYAGVQIIESNALTPLIMKRAVSLPPALILLFQVAMSVLFGFIGLLVAVPLLAVLKVLVQRLYVEQLANGS